MANDFWSRALKPAVQQPAPQVGYRPQATPPYSPQTMTPQRQPLVPPQQFDPSRLSPDEEITFTDAMRVWKGGKGARLNPEQCPNCGSNNYFVHRRDGAGPQPAPHCYECGHNGIYEQGLPPGT